SLSSDPGRDRGTLMIVSFRNHRLSIKDKQSAVSFQEGKIRDIGTEKLNLKEIVHDERKKTILVVEDNVSMVNYLQRKLSNKYNVTVALNGNDALRIIRVPGSS